MFALTKQQKTKRLLIDNYNLSLAVTQQKAEIPLSDPLVALRQEENSIATKRIALSYDTLKEAYIDFTKLNSRSDMWKLNKPVTAEGKVFTASYISNELDNITHSPLLSERLRYLLQTNTIAQRAEPHATQLLLQAIHAKARNDIIAKAGELFGTAYKDLSLLHSYVLYTYCKHHNTVLFTSSTLPFTLLERVAKIAHTNIVIIKD